MHGINLPTQQKRGCFRMKIREHPFCFYSAIACFKA